MGTFGAISGTPRLKEAPHGEPLECPSRRTIHPPSVVSNYEATANHLGSSKGSPGGSHASHECSRRRKFRSDTDRPGHAAPRSAGPGPQVAARTTAGTSDARPRGDDGSRRLDAAHQR